MVDVDLGRTAADKGDLLIGEGVRCQSSRQHHAAARAWLVDIVIQVASQVVIAGVASIAVGVGPPRACRPLGVNLGATRASRSHLAERCQAPVSRAWTKASLGVQRNTARR